MAHEAKNDRRRGVADDLDQASGPSVGGRRRSDDLLVTTGAGGIGTTYDEPFGSRIGRSIGTSDAGVNAAAAGANDQRFAAGSLVQHKKQAATKSGAFTKKDAEKLTTLALRAAASAAKQANEAIEAATGEFATEAPIAFEGGCFAAAKHLAQASNSMQAFDTRSVDSRKLRKPADLAAYWIQKLLAWGADNSRTEYLGYQQLSQGFDRFAARLKGVGWKPKRSRRRAKRAARQSRLSATLSTNEKRSMVRLSLDAARKNLRGAPKEGKGRLTTGAEFAAGHIKYAASEISTMEKGERSAFKADIVATSTAVGGLAFHAARAKLLGEAEMKSLMAAEKKLMKLVGLKAPPAFTRRPADPKLAPVAGTPIKTTTRLGNPNDLGGAFDSVTSTWQALLLAQLAGVQMIEKRAESPPNAVPEHWKQLIQTAITLGLVFVTRGLAARVTAGFTEHVIGAAMRGGGDIASGSVLADKIDYRKLIAVNKSVHGIVSSKVVSTLQSRAASGSTKILTKPDGNPTRDVLMQAFFSEHTDVLNQKALDDQVAFNNQRGDYQALEDESPGAGFAALEGWRNALRVEANRAIDVQATKTLAAWLTFLAKCDLGVLPRSKNDKNGDGGTDLGQSGGVGTDDRTHLGAREEWAQGLLRLELNAGDMSIRSAHVAGVNAKLKSMLAKRRIGDLQIPIVARGNILGATKKAEPGEIRFGRNERGTVWCIPIESERNGPSGKRDYPVARFIRQINSGMAGTPQVGVGGALGATPITENERFEAAARVFSRFLRDKTLSSLV